MLCSCGDKDEERERRQMVSRVERFIRMNKTRR